MQRECVPQHACRCTIELLRSLGSIWIDLSCSLHRLKSRALHRTRVYEVAGALVAGALSAGALSVGTLSAGTLSAGTLSAGALSAGALISVGALSAGALSVGGALGSSGTHRLLPIDALTEQECIRIECTLTELEHALLL